MRFIYVLALLWPVLPGSSSEWESETILDFAAPKQPDYLIVASRQRSSSSTLSRLIASHPCALHGNEIFSKSPNQDHLSAHDIAGMSQPEIYADPHLYLTKAREGVCAEAVADGTIPEVCGGQCTIVIKLMDIFGLPQAGIVSLMEDHRMEFVVLERGIHGEYCSYAKALAQGDWGTTPGQHMTSLPDVPCSEVPQKFVDAHVRWFTELRYQLRQSSRFFIDVPFGLVASCGLKALVESIYGTYGFLLPVEIDFPEDLEKLFAICP